MSLSELAVIQSPLCSSRCIQVIAEFSSKKLARGVRLGEVGNGGGREEGGGLGNGRMGEERSGRRQR